MMLSSLFETSKKTGDGSNDDSVSGHHPPHQPHCLTSPSTDKNKKSDEYEIVNEIDGINFKKLSKDLFPTDVDIQPIPPAVSVDDIRGEYINDPLLSVNTEEETGVQDDNATEEEEDGNGEDDNNSSSLSVHVSDVCEEDLKSLLTPPGSVASNSSPKLFDHTTYDDDNMNDNVKKESIDDIQKLIETTSISPKQEKVQAADGKNSTNYHDDDELLDHALQPHKEENNASNCTSTASSKKSKTNNVVGRILILLAVFTISYFANKITEFKNDQVTSQEVIEVTDIDDTNSELSPSENQTGDDYPSETPLLRDNQMDVESDLQLLSHDAEQTCDDCSLETPLMYDDTKTNPSVETEADVVLDMLEKVIHTQGDNGSTSNGNWICWDIQGLTNKFNFAYQFVKTLVLGALLLCASFFAMKQPGNGKIVPDETYSCNSQKTTANPDECYSGSMPITSPKGEDYLSYYDLASYYDLKVVQLRELLKSRNCSLLGRKPALVKRLAKVYATELESLTVFQLRPLLKRQNLSLAGKKVELIQRLVEAGVPDCKVNTTTPTKVIKKEVGC